MTAKPFRVIPKPDWLRLTGLEQALLVVRDSLDGIRSGKGYFALPLAGQLRALLADRRRDSPALLPKMADELGVGISIFAAPEINAEGTGELIINLGGHPISFDRLSSDQVEVTLDAALDRRVLRIKQSEYTVRELIKIAAEKGGGAHHPPGVPEADYDLLTFRELGLRPMQIVLESMGQVSLSVGRALIRELCDLDLHVVVVLPPTRTTIICLVDARDPESGARLSLHMDPLGRVILHAVGVDGSWLRLASDSLAPSAKQVHVMASLRLSPALHTVAAIAIDGTPAGQIDVAKPTLLSSSQQDYEVIINRAFDNSTLTGEFALARVAIARAGFNLVEDAEIVQEMAAPAERFNHFLAGDTLQFGTRSSGEAPAPAPGSTRIDNPEMLSLSELEGRWKPKSAG